MRLNHRGAYCVYCKRQLTASTDRGSCAMTRDHILPRALGGTAWAPCCRRCNQLKGNIHPEEWFAFIDAYPGYWKTFATEVQVRLAISRMKECR